MFLLWVVGSQQNFNFGMKHFSVEKLKSHLHEECLAKWHFKSNNP